MSSKFLFEINLGNLDKFYQVKRAKALMLQFHNWSKIIKKISILHWEQFTRAKCTSLPFKPQKVQQKKITSMRSVKKLHIQIKTDIKNTVKQALLKIWNILLYITSEKNTETVFPTLDSDNLTGTASKKDFSELSLWLLWRYTCTRSSLAQRHGRNMSLLKSDHTWTSMLSLTRLDFW